jgi:predicted ABC-type ATPase
MKSDLFLFKLFSRWLPRNLERRYDSESDLKRKKLHQQIIGEILKQASKQLPHQKPVAYFVGGGSASGKSTLRKRIMKEHNLDAKYFIGVDPDELKNFIPEYEYLKKTNPIKAAAKVHKESCQIRDQLVERLIADRKSFIYESTLAKPRKYQTIFQNLIQQDYEIHLYITDIPLELAKKRAARRGEIGGRTVPLSVIKNTHKLVPKTFLAVKSLADSYSVYENSHSLKLIVSKTIKDKEIYEKFLRKKD